MSKRLLEKAGLIGQPQVSEPPVLNRSTPAALDIPRPKTAPGTMLGFMSAQSAAVQEVEVLRGRLKDFDGAIPVRSLDPALIVPSKWANRHAVNFADPDFAALKDEIRQAGGNVQPVKVRPLPKVLNGSTPSEAEFEIVFGHRRHRACLELGIPVNALVETVSEQQLFEQMERENRGRKNLSAWEQGCMYRQALDEGLYPSQRKLSESLGVDLSMVSKSLKLARLPQAIVDTFTSPLDIQYRWAQPLADVVQKDPDGTIAKAKSLAAVTPRLSAAQVFVALTSQGSTVSMGQADGSVVIIAAGKRQLGRIETDVKGRAVIRFEAGVLPEDKRQDLARIIENFLAG